jgi:predicted nucleic acid-binding protein
MNTGHSSAALPLLVDDPSQRHKKTHGTRNPDDAPILAAATASGADCLVTWDKKHFLKKAVDSRTDMKILSPGEFLKLFRSHIEE